MGVDQMTVRLAEVVCQWIGFVASLYARCCVLQVFHGGLRLPSTSPICEPKQTNGQYQIYPNTKTKRFLGESQDVNLMVWTVHLILYKFICLILCQRLDIARLSAGNMLRPLDVYLLKLLGGQVDKLSGGNQHPPSRAIGWGSSSVAQLHLIDSQGSSAPSSASQEDSHPNLGVP